MSQKVKSLNVLFIIEPAYSLTASQNCPKRCTKFQARCSVFWQWAASMSCRRQRHWSITVFVTNYHPAVTARLSSLTVQNSEKNKQAVDKLHKHI